MKCVGQYAEPSQTPPTVMEVIVVAQWGWVIPANTLTWGGVTPRVAVAGAARKSREGLKKTEKKNPPLMRTRLQSH